MAIARSKLTAQSQISVPKAVRSKLGIGPGSVLEWEQDGGKIVVHRAGLYTSEDIHRKIFGAKKPKAQSIENMEKGIAE
jgi:AbrB family looped-hinge helix DNA binding protein